MRLREKDLDERIGAGIWPAPQREKELRWMPRRGRKAKPGRYPAVPICGAGQQRPVLVLTRDAAIGHLTTVTVTPITSTIRGVRSEVVLDVEGGMESRCAANLHNAVTMAQSRLGRRVATLRSERRREICEVLCFSLGC